jgi:hypothetical protein
MSEQTAQKSTADPTNDGSSEIPEGPIFPFQVPVNLVFNTFIDPPIGYDMHAIDAAHPNYRVKIMSVIDPRRVIPPFEVPFTEPIQLTPFAAAPDIWDFQMVGVTEGVIPADPTTPTPLLYYKSLTVIQGAPGLRKTRSRVFTTPQLNPTPGGNHVDAVDLVPGSPAFFRVSSVPDNSGFLVTVLYKHVVIANAAVDPTGPRHMFLQQPFV